MSTEEEVPVVPKKSKGQIFKEKHGYSKTMKRNMKKAGVTSIEDYRKIRKERKKVQSQIAKRKHSVASAQRDSKSSSNKKK